MKTEAFKHENAWRPNYELTAATTWALATCVAFAVKELTALPEQPFYWMICIAFIMMFLRFPAAISIWRLHRNLNGQKTQFISIAKLAKKVEKKKGLQWMGSGFVWENRHAQRAYEILDTDASKIVKNDLAKVASNEIGYPWIHGLEPNEQPILQNLNQADLMNLVLGTTGAGKTRYFELIIVQAILRGEPVIIIDPKGDQGLRDTAKRVCEYMGRPEAYKYFHPAFPEKSIRLDLLRNFSRPTELASRISALIANGSGPDPFIAFGWRAINSLCQAFFIAHERTSIVNLKRYLETGVEQMVIKAISSYAQNHIPDADSKIEQAYTDAGGAKASLAKLCSAFIRLYYIEIQPIRTSPELDSLISMVKHDHTHFGKMITNVLPILAQLTTGELSRLLSPDYQDLDDPREITDNAKIIDNNYVLVMGLDSLADAITGSAIGSLELADLVAYSSDRYNFKNPDDLKPVNIFIDESAEVMNEPTIQMLNKGRGAKMRLYIASQTIADFEARLGSAAKATQVLANLNNVIALRCNDEKTQEFVVNSLPKTKIKSVAYKKDRKADKDQPLLFTSGYGETLDFEDADIFPAGLIGELKTLEYIAKLSGTVVKGRLPILSRD